MRPEKQYKGVEHRNQSKYIQNLNHDKKDTSILERKG